MSIGGVSEESEQQQIGMQEWPLNLAGHQSVTMMHAVTACKGLRRCEMSVRGTFLNEGSAGFSWFR